MNIAIFGYGNLGRSVELNSAMNDDMNLVGVFTRRNPALVKTSGATVYSASDILKFRDRIDVLIICGGSATDLPEMTPALAKDFNVVDSFDTHARMAEHLSRVDAAALSSRHTAVIAAGWDPGLFSLARIYSESVLPNGRTCTFWGRGVSQGHSDAIRRIPGVVDARQYTVPNSELYAEIRSGRIPEGVELNAQNMHIRDCYVVAAPDADRGEIERRIKTMPNYFEGYETHVTFVPESEFAAKHAGLPHGGSVIRCGSTSTGERHTVEFRLDLESNPEFTSSVLLAYARAAYRLSSEGSYGCKTVFDIAPKYLSPQSYEDLVAHSL